jgi:phosphotransferase system HPr (HPr) family protein
MPEVELRVRNPSGLHARPAATFVKAAAEFRADVRVANLDRDPERAVSAKSVIGVLGIGVSSGHRVRLAAEGVDADAAIATLARLVEAGLGESVDPAEPA